jgi:hypothetical protein
MKNKMFVLAFGLLLMPNMATGQSPDVEIVGPTPFRGAEPAPWRDSYINWRGRKIFDPDWRTFKADNGAIFAVDMKSIVNISHDGVLVSSSRLSGRGGTTSTQTT